MKVIENVGWSAGAGFISLLKDRLDLHLRCGGKKDLYHYLEL